MSIASFGRADLAERQRAFTGLLAHPLVNPWTRPALYSLVTRHEHIIDLWCTRLGYRLVRIDQCFRLRRTPVDGRVTVPAGRPRSRRPLVLALLIAAVLEDHRQESVTLQEISDAVRHFSAANGFAPYDPEHRSHRAALVAGVQLLVDHGALDQRTSRLDLLDSWERSGSGIGAGYLVHRDALVLVVDTRDVQLSLEPQERVDDTRSQRLLRSLVETQSLHPLSLDESDRVYLTAQRRRLIDQAEEMTGGTVEPRTDAWVLVLPSDHGLDPELTIGFPEATADDWVSLALLDAAGRSATIEPDGRRRCPNQTVTALATAVHAEHGPALTLALQESAVALRRAAEDRLLEVGLLTTDAGDWLLEPEAGRFRSAELQVPRRAPVEPTALFEVDA